MIRSGSGRGHVSLELGDELLELGAGVVDRVGSEAVDDVAAPFGEVHDAPTEAVGVEGEAQHVDGRFEELRAAPSNNRSTASFAPTSSPYGRTTTAGYGM